MGVKKVLVLGGNFGGLTAALTVQYELRGDVDVTVLSANDQFLFDPSLISLPFGNRAPEEITFPLAPTFDAQGISFSHTSATTIDLAGKRVTSTSGHHDFDYLVIATGHRGDFAAVPGLGPGNNGVIIMAGHLMAPRKHGVLIPGPQAHAMKLGFEKYFMWKARNGHVMLP